MNWNENILCFKESLLRLDQLICVISLSLFVQFTPKYQKKKRNPPFTYIPATYAYFSFLFFFFPLHLKFNILMNFSPLYYIIFDQTICSLDNFLASPVNPSHLMFITLLKSFILRCSRVGNTIPVHVLPSSHPSRLFKWRTYMYLKSFRVTYSARREA